MNLKIFKKNNEKAPQQSQEDKKDGSKKILRMIEETGKVDLKKIKSNYVQDLVKKYKSIEEQNKYLSKYL